MVTIFAIPKAFNKDFATIQINAIKSWKQITNDIILFGDDVGVGHIAKKLRIQHVKKVEKNLLGTPILSGIFSDVQKRAQYNLLAYVNADVILLGDFLHGIKYIHFQKFLAIGKRHNIGLKKAIRFGEGWERRVLRELKKQKRDNPIGNSSEFFLFPKSVRFNIPKFAIGRLYWDSWLIYRSRQLKLPVIDMTPSICYLHQIHSYKHHKNGFDGVWYGTEAKRNYQLAGGNKTRFKVDDANWVLTGNVVRRKNWSIRQFVREIRIVEILHPWTSPIVFPIYFVTVSLFKLWRLLQVLPNMSARNIRETLSKRGLLEYKFREL